jgi:hypothetical protein
MYPIKVYAELHWAVERPELQFYIDNQLLKSDIEIVTREGTVEKLIYTVLAEQQTPEQLFKICLINKRDELITKESDHWVDIKNIIIDGIPADWSLLKESTFKHSMSKEWISDMESQGYNIQTEYCPGTVMRINGEFLFKIKHPFIDYRVLKEWENYYDLLK